MTPPWKSLHKPKQIDVLSPEGKVRCSVMAYGGNDLFIVDDVKNADIRTGDEIRTLLPNGREEAFTVVDPRFYDSNSGFGTHYQIKVKRKNTFPRHEGGFYSISVNGDGSRVNISSVDNSQNNITNNDRFEKLMHVLIKSEIEDSQKSELLSYAAAMQTAKEQKDFSGAYQKFVAAAANHMTVITPFLPFLTNLLTNFHISL